MKPVKVLIFVILMLAVCSISVGARTTKLTNRQLKTLNRKLSLKVRNFLQTAETFEIWTDTVQETPDEKPVYKPNKRLVIKKASTRAKVLNAFFYDIATGGNGAACFYPNHSFVARRGKKFIRLTICYTCGEFTASGSFGQWDAGISTKDPISSEVLINRLLEKYGVPVPAR